MPPVLRLYEDILANDGAELSLPALPHLIYVVHGSIAIADRMTHSDEGFGGDSATRIKGGPEGATVWRWELAADDASDRAPAGATIVSREKLSARLDALPKGPLLLRGDSVAFPPDGCAYLHRHQGPGIRCLLEGGIRIDTAGHSTSYGPGGAWYESGPEPVFAQAANRADPLHSCHDPADGLFGEKLGGVSARRRQGQAADAEVQNLHRHADRFARNLSVKSETPIGFAADSWR